MLTKIGYSAAYGMVFAVHGEMNVFLRDLGERRGWTLVADLVRIRFSSAVETFLDAPTAQTLARVVAFRSEMELVGRSATGNRR